MSDDRTHFASYREQTRVKHAILSDYAQAFFTILASRWDRLIYLDGFAGRGTYDGPAGPVPGSPLRILELLASKSTLGTRVDTLFVEQNPETHASLCEAVDRFYDSHRETLRKPRVRCGDFTAQVRWLLDHHEQTGIPLPPTFVLVDPCGVDGASFETIQRFLAHPQAEVLVFFNLDGVRRIVGLGDAMGPTLPELLGGRDRAEELIRRVAAEPEGVGREDAIIGYYRDLLRSETRARFVTAFRVESEHKRTTSHYLVHATGHPRGFAIMKDVMWRVGRNPYGGSGLMFAQASVTGSSLFDPDRVAIERRVLAELAAGAKPVEHFTEALVCQPDDTCCAKGYKDAILALERAEKIRILAKDGSGRVASRRPGTLGEGYFVERVVR